MTTPRRFSLPATPAARASAGLAVLALLGMGIAAANTEALVAGRFTAALEAAPRQIASDVRKDRPLVAGSEAYWLDEKRHPEGAGAALEPAAWSVAPFAAALSVGDRITISGGKGERVLEVVAITEAVPADGAETAGAHGAALRNLAITCRDTTTPDAQLVTFLVPAEPALRTARPARAL
jgi:hypothetical protein